MVLGIDDIGDYSQYASKESLRQELIEVYDNSTSRKNQALMAWNFANTVSINDIIFAKRSNTLVGKGIVTGSYIFDALRQEYKNIRTVKWIQVGEWEHPVACFMLSVGKNIRVGIIRGIVISDILPINMSENNSGNLTFLYI